MTLPSLRLKANADRRLRAGHLWVYSNEIDVAATPLNGFQAGDQAILEAAGGKNIRPFFFLDRVPGYGIHEMGLARMGADPALAQAKLARSRTALGALLMNQTVLAGVGNVYRAEILFRHGVHAYLAGRDLDPVVWLDMWEDLVRLMRSGVRSGKIITTDPDDRERRSGPARRVDAHYVYRRTGEPCRRCDTPIAHAVMLTRNLFWCPRCQPEPRDGALGAGIEVATTDPGLPVTPDEDE